MTTAGQPQPKRYRAGTHRIRSPSQTLAEYLPKAEAVGITRLANITGLDCVGIPVYNAIRPNSRSLSVSQGKGITHDAAKVSALMESIEYWHAEHVSLPLRHESYQRLVREATVVDVRRLPLRGGLDWIGPGRETPARATLRLDLPMLWVEGHELLSGQPIWLPFETVRLNKVGLDYAQNTFRVDSNGLASGNSWSEAAVHALCELVERDALTRWWQGVEGPADVAAGKLDLASIEDPACNQLLTRFDTAGLDVAVWDVTSDTGVPAYQCCVLDRSEPAGWRPFGAAWGYGAHPATDVALARALTEAAQSRVTMIAGSRDDNFPTQYAAHHDPSTSVLVRELFFSEPGAVDFGSRHGPETSTVDGDLGVLLACLRSVDIDCAALVDLSRPELGIPTVKAVVPGLEFFSLFVGYAPGPRAGKGASNAGRGRAG
jgi:YcaO-like protein with predicted kinase domain